MICVPWLSQYEWHAFSLFAHPAEPHTSCLCVSVNGDWTKALHHTVRHSTVRPIWLSGPFASPYSTAIRFDNFVLVASGIGITPALSIIATHKESRRTNLIWTCRDAALLEFYLKNGKWDGCGWTLVYYTGRRRLVLDTAALPASVLVFHGRPGFDRIIRAIIESIELGEGLPEHLTERAREYGEHVAELNAQLLRDGASLVERFTALVKQQLEAHSLADFSLLLRQAQGRKLVAADVADDFELTGQLDSQTFGALADLVAPHHEFSHDEVLTLFEHFTESESVS
eukprot:6622573-Prymnesium_polylepis.1